MKEDKGLKKVVWDWECVECGDKVTSYSYKRHDMNYCKCGKSYVDLEEWYARSSGTVNVLDIKVNP
jgi:hypothetical protein